MNKAEALKALDEAKESAKRAARRRFPPGMVGDVSSVLADSRLRVIEARLATLAGQHSQYAGASDMKIILELRDYWEAVADDLTLGPKVI